MELDAPQMIQQNTMAVTKPEPLKVPEKKGSRGYRFTVLAFIAYTVSFYVMLFAPGEFNELRFKLYFVYCAFSALALGFFTAKDIFNLRTFMSFGGHVNGNGNGKEAQPQ